MHGEPRGATLGSRGFVPPNLARPALRLPNSAEAGCAISSVPPLRAPPYRRTMLRARASIAATLAAAWDRMRRGPAPRWQAAQVLPTLAFAAPAAASAMRLVLRDAAHGERHPVLRMGDDGFGVVYLAGAAAAAPLTRRDLRRAGLSEPALHQQALANLATLAERGPQPLHCVPLPQRLFALTMGSARASSLVLLDTLWDERIAARLCARPVVGIPSRGLCVFADAEDPHALQALRRFTTRVACNPQRRHDRLSGALFVRRDGAWRTLDGQ